MRFERKQRRGETALTRRQPSEFPDFIRRLRVVVIVSGMAFLTVLSCMPNRVKVELADPVPGAGWPGPRLDDANTAFLDAAVTLPDQLLWETKTGGDVRAEPTADRGIIVAAVQSNRLFFVDAATGKVLHREEFAGPPTSAVFLNDSLAFAVDAKRPHLYFWDIAYQRAGRELPITRIVAPPAFLPQGQLVQMYDGTVTLIGPDSDTVWTYHLPPPLLTDAAYAGERLYIVSGGKRVVCLREDDGTLLWEHSSAGGHAASPAVDGLVYFGSLDSNFYALDCETGEMRWFFHTGGQIFTSPAVDRGRVYFGANDGFFYALDKQSGALIWKLSAGLVHNSSPVVWDTVVIFGTSDGRVLVVDAQVGRLVREFRTRGGIYCAPIVYQDRIYVADAKRRLYCFGPTPRSE